MRDSQLEEHSTDEALDAEVRALLAAPHKIPLTRLRLSYRTNRVLGEAGVMTLGELTGWSAEGLLALRSFGQTCLREVERMVRDFGLSLSPTLPKVRPEKQPRQKKAKTGQPETPRQQKSRELKERILALRAEGREVREVAAIVGLSRQQVYARLAAVHKSARREL